MHTKKYVHVPIAQITVLRWTFAGHQKTDMISGAWDESVSPPWTTNVDIHSKEKWQSHKHIRMSLGGEKGKTYVLANQMINL